jgi:hypothetical protein
MAELVSDSDLDDIDYMHPNGKPQTVASDTEIDARPSWQDLRIAMQEADGHYVPRRDPYLEEIKVLKDLNDLTERASVQERTDRKE